jgi:serine/threonine-protein kinase
VIVYEVLCGRRPYDGQGGNLLRQILNEPPPPVSTFEPRLPVTIDMVLGRALAKKPENRFRSARELLDALKNAFPGVAAAKTGLAGNVGALRKALATSPAPAPRPAKPAVRRPSILFVDDEKRIVSSLEHLFGESYEVETATGGIAALERLRARRFHVLVSDQRMPDMPGVELLRQAKELAPRTVRLLLTGYSDLAAIVGSVNDSEVFRFVSKPWQEEDLRATLAEAVDVAIALEAAAAVAAPALARDATVLVLGEPALARAARELAKDAYRVREATGIDAALEVLAAEEIGTLVCDLDIGAGDPAALLRILKKQSPQTQLIAASSASDSELIISLINEARIYRFLRKPVNYSLLQAATVAALGRYARMMQSPAMLRAESARRGRQGTAERTILGRLKSLGGRFAATFKN